MTAATALLALLLDAALGDPPWLWRRLPHPVVLLGRLIERLESLLLRPAAVPRTKRAAGILLILLVVSIAALAGWLLHRATALLPAGWIVEALLISTLLAQRSLVEHVGAVADALERSLVAAREAVSRIVGRDPERLDRPAIGRAAIESLAENLSDGVIAPLFWALLLGLPGILAYKAINTADSMIGHKSERYRDFGWASARLDDLVNLPPARLTGLLLALAAPSRLTAAIAAMRRDAPHHRSPNAGWPEAAMAAALGLRLAGPRSYNGRIVSDGWMGDGRAEVDARDIRRAIGLAWRAWGLALLLTLLFALATWRW